MTQLDVVYSYGVSPSETAAIAIGRVREIYGVRAIAFDETAKTIRVEYDATRLNEPMIHQFLRRAGLDIVDNIRQFSDPPPPPEPAAAAPAPAK